MSMTPASPSASVAREAVSTQVDGVRQSLSPSRAADFVTCPWLYRSRHVAHLPEPTSPDALRGSLVHRVLEVLFDEPPEHRTVERSGELLVPAWEQLLDADPSIAELFADTDLDQWLASARVALERYFTLEDPRRLEPAAKELYVETELDSRLVLRGYVDRLDESPEGLLRIVDYKSGRAPGVGFESGAMFQLRFYALVIWRTRGVIPAMLQLLYLGSGEILRYEPDEHDLRATQRKTEAIWAAIRRAEDSDDFRPRPSSRCTWCAFTTSCPAFA